MLPDGATAPTFKIVKDDARAVIAHALAEGIVSALDIQGRAFAVRYPIKRSRTDERALSGDFTKVATDFGRAFARETSRR